MFEPGKRLIRCCTFCSLMAIGACEIVSGVDDYEVRDTADSGTSATGGKSGSGGGGGGWAAGQAAPVGARASV